MQLLPNPHLPQSCHCLLCCVEMQKCNFLLKSLLMALSCSTTGACGSQEQPGAPFWEFQQQTTFIGLKIHRSAISKGEVVAVAAVITEVKTQTEKSLPNCNLLTFQIKVNMTLHY